MIRIFMGDTELSKEDAGKWMADILDMYPNINIRFNAYASQAKELKAIRMEREKISKAMEELVEIIELLGGKLNSASDNQLDKLVEIESSIEDLYTGVQIVKFNK